MKKLLFHTYFSSSVVIYRVFFENNFFEHAEVAEVNNMVGFFLDPEKTVSDNEK